MFEPTALYEGVAERVLPREPGPRPGPLGAVLRDFSTRRYRFGEYSVDEALCEVRRAGVEVKLRRKPFEVLVYLLRHADHVVSKDELLEQVWHHTAVSESSLANCVSEIRAALGDRRRDGGIVQTIYGRGYRFCAEIEPTRSATAADAPGPSVRVEGEANPLHPRRVFVGRRRELTRLGHTLKDVSSGTGSVALLVGEAGIGKTSLMDRFLEEAVRQRACVLVMRCSRDGRPAPWPWIEMLRRQLDERQLGDACAAAGTAIEELSAPDLEEREVGADSPPSVTSSSSRVQLFSAVRGVLTELSRRSPCVVAIDDLQDADQASLMFLGLLARKLRYERVLFVGALDAVPRSSEHPLTRLAADLQHEVAADVIGLTPLTEQEVGEYLQGVLGRPPEKALVSAIHARTEGHPLFLREFVELLEGEGWPSAGKAPVIPTGVRATVQLRLDRLEKSCRQLLEVAAVGGREISVPLVQRVAGLDAPACLDELQRAVEASLICEVSPLERPGVYRFAHGILCDVLYEGLPARKRIELHQRYGAELEGQHVEPSVIAHHFSKSNDPADLTKAFAAAERAGHRATRQGAHDHAADYYEAALSILARLGEPDARKRCDLLLARTAALRRSHQYALARKEVNRAIESARKVRAMERLAVAALVWEGPDTLGTTDPARIRLVDEALAGIPAGESELRAHLLLGRIIARWAVDPPSLTAQRCRELIDMADRRRYPVAQTVARWFLHASLHGRAEEIEERHRVRAEAVRIASEDSDPVSELTTRGVLLGDLAEVGDAEGMDREIATIERLAGTARKSDSRLLCVTGMRALLRGDLEEAEDRFLNLWGDTQFSPRGVACPPGFTCQKFVLRREQGRLAELESPVRAGRAQMPALGLWQALLALLLVETGRAEEARREIERIFETGIDALPRNAFWLGTIVFLAEAASTLGDERYAAALYERLLPYRGRAAIVKSFVCLGPVDLALGRLATVCGWWSRAAGHIQEADRLAEKLEAAPSLARIERARADLRVRARNSS